MSLEITIKIVAFSTTWCSFEGDALAVAMNLEKIYIGLYKHGQFFRVIEVSL